VPCHKKNYNSVADSDRHICTKFCMVLVINSGMSADGGKSPAHSLLAYLLWRSDRGPTGRSPERHLLKGRHIERITVKKYVA